jgi:opacity protein-like surface antigen
MANYVTAEGGVNLAAYKTRITSSFSYGWLSQNEDVFNNAGLSFGAAGLSASTVAGDISGVTRPIEALSLRYSYKAYDFANNNLNNNLLMTLSSFLGANRPLLYQEQYSYLRQNMTLGADYKVNSMLALDAAYTYSTVDRTENQGNTSSNSPQFGIRLFPTSWLNLTANYAYLERLGNDFLSLSPGNLLTYKFYSGDDRRNTANFIAEAFPVNNVTFSANFSFYKDTFNNSNGYGLNNDQGWSAGGDVSWTPTERVALSLGYDHQEAITKERTAQIGLVPGAFIVTGDWGPLLSTLDSYDTVTARADFKLIPDKLKLTTGASYSFSSSHFDNGLIPDLNEAFADVNASLSYKFNEHWGCRVGYRFEIFNMTKSYQALYLTGIPATANQSLNTLDGFYRNATAHVLEGFVQYRF